MHQVASIKAGTINDAAAKAKALAEFFKKECTAFICLLWAWVASDNAGLALKPRRTKHPLNLTNHHHMPDNPKHDHR